MRSLAPLLLTIAMLASPARAQVLEPHTRTLNFGTVVGEAAAERPLTVTNRGKDAVRIRNVQLTPPLSVSRMPAVIEPGQSTDILVRLGSPRPSGRFAGDITVNLEGSAEPLAVEANAIVTPPIEIVPSSGLVAVTERGRQAEASVEIVNHLERPLVIKGGATTNERYATGLATVEPGQRYRLVLAMSGRGSAGRQTDTIALQTDDAAMPVVNVPARTLLRERVYTFPESVDFGRIGTALPSGRAPVTTSLMVYQSNGKDFQIQVASDLPFLEIRPEKSATFGDRWQISCSIDPSNVPPGRVEGSITVVTNDPEFPKLSIPVLAVVN